MQAEEAFQHVGRTAQQQRGRFGLEAHLALVAQKPQILVQLARFRFGVEQRAQRNHYAAARAQPLELRRHGLPRFVAQLARGRARSAELRAGRHRQPLLPVAGLGGQFAPNDAPAVIGLHGLAQILQCGKIAARAAQDGDARAFFLQRAEHDFEELALGVIDEGAGCCSLDVPRAFQRLQHGYGPQDLVARDLGAMQVDLERERRQQRRDGARCGRHVQPDFDRDALRRQNQRGIVRIRHSGPPILHCR